MKLFLVPKPRFSPLTCSLFVGLGAFAPLLIAPAGAQDALPPATVSASAGDLPAGTPAAQAAFLVDAAFDVANRNPAARVAAVRDAAALLPRLSPAATRDALTQRWLNTAMSPSVPRAVRLNATAGLFDVAAKSDLPWANAWATKIPDAAARAGALVAVSRGYERATGPNSWNRAAETASLAQRAARSETDPTQRARALVFVAYRMTELAPDRTPDAIREASSQVRLIQSPSVRDNLMAELAGAAARYDLALGRRMAGEISSEGLKNLATARVNLTEVSQTTLTSRSKERITALAAAAAPYDARALPVLLQLPGQPEVLKAVGDTLPRIYPSATPAIETSQLERMWAFAQAAPAGPYRDQLQSRLARLMVLKDLWRGRDWGKQLSWQGGRIQVGAFLNEVLEARRSNLGIGALQDTAKTDAGTAYSQALTLPPAARTEALLLLAGQILG